MSSTCKKDKTLADEVHDLMDVHGSSDHLSAPIIQVLDRLEEAFSSSDPESLLKAVNDLGAFWDDELLAVRADELLEASNLQKSRNSKLAALEAEILRRFSRVLRRSPHRTKAFVQQGLPEPLLAVLRRQRMLRTVREMTGGGEGRCKEKEDEAKSDMRELPYQSSHLPAQRAISSYHLASKDQGQLSQAVLKLPWSANEQWERRWEQDPWKMLMQVFRLSFATLNLEPKLHLGDPLFVTLLCFFFFAEARNSCGILESSMARTKHCHSRDSFTAEIALRPKNDRRSRPTSRDADNFCWVAE